MHSGRKEGFALALLDGYYLYTAGNFFPISGGFNNTGYPVNGFF